MVTLVVSDINQLSFLERELMEANIPYSTRLDDGAYGLVAPYLLVYNVPLDFTRASKWIKEYKNEH